MPHGMNYRKHTPSQDSVQAFPRQELRISDAMPSCA